MYESISLLILNKKYILFTALALFWLPILPAYNNKYAHEEPLCLPLKNIGFTTNLGTSPVLILYNNFMPTLCSKPWHQIFYEASLNCLNVDIIVLQHAPEAPITIYLKNIFDDLFSQGSIPISETIKVAHYQLTPSFYTRPVSLEFLKQTFPLSLRFNPRVNYIYGPQEAPFYTAFPVTVSPYLVPSKLNPLAPEFHPQSEKIYALVKMSSDPDIQTVSIASDTASFDDTESVVSDTSETTVSVHNHSEKTELPIKEHDQEAEQTAELIDQRSEGAQRITDVLKAHILKLKQSKPEAKLQKAIALEPTQNTLTAPTTSKPHTLRKKTISVPKKTAPENTCDLLKKQARADKDHRKEINLRLTSLEKSKILSPQEQRELITYSRDTLCTEELRNRACDRVLCCYDSFFDNPHIDHNILIEHKDGTYKATDLFCDLLGTGFRLRNKRSIAWTAFFNFLEIPCKNGCPEHKEIFCILSKFKDNETYAQKLLAICLSKNCQTLIGLNNA